MLLLHTKLPDRIFKCCTQVFREFCSQLIRKIDFGEHFCNFEIFFVCFSFLSSLTVNRRFTYSKRLFTCMQMRNPTSLSTESIIQIGTDGEIQTCVSTRSAQHLRPFKPSEWKMRVHRPSAQR